MIKYFFPSLFHMLCFMFVATLVGISMNVAASMNYDNKALYEGVCTYSTNQEKKYISTDCDGHVRISTNPSQSLMWNVAANSTTYCKVLETLKKEKLFRCED